MAETIKVTVENQFFEVAASTTFYELAQMVKEQYPDDIALAKYNGKLTELFKPIREDGEVLFLTTASSAGRRTYRRSVTMLLQCAIHRVDPKLCVDVECSLDQGFFCRFRNEEFRDGVPQELLDRIKTQMQSLVEQDIPIVKRSVGTDEAIKMFKKVDMLDKGNLFRYRSSSRVNVYSILDFIDYYYGYMMPSTGMLSYFDLTAYHEGFVLLFPNEDTRKVASFNPSYKLYKVLEEASDWGSMLQVSNIGQLNDAIANGRMQDIILVQEALMEGKISEIAKQIVERGSKFVMIAGPSSSGKTSFSHRLSIQLMAQGLKPHPIGLDNYYGDRETCPRDENGNLDFECLEALDVEQFNIDMQRLLDGERVEIPSFNFKTGKREYRGNFLQLGNDDVLVIEGIHGLNDKLSYTIDAKDKYKIYISALTQLNIDEHNCLHTTDGRLLRRIVRDARTRATSAKETIAMWYSVRRGEEKYIFPHQESADVMFNSAFIYELAVIKPYVQPLLYQIQPGEDEYDEAKRLLKLLDYILPIPSEDINNNSIFREFIGGSCFNV